MDLESLIETACPDLREITFHSDGRVIAKTGGKAKNPKKLYSAKFTGKESWAERARIAVSKLLKENK